MPYELVPDHWIISVNIGNDHGDPYYDAERLFLTEESFKEGLQEVINSYYDSVNHVAEVKKLQWRDDEYDEN